MSAKIITIEGTDCSGKETQSKILEHNLTNKGYKVKRFSFPQYEEGTGKIIGGAYLGKTEIGECVFAEGAVNVDPIVASLYYAADRRYSFLKTIEEEMEKNDVIILDRYVTSNLGHQGSKIHDKDKQDKFFDLIFELEYKICELPESDITIFLHMPLEATKSLKKNRASLDQHEQNDEHLKQAELTYLRLYKKYGWKYINCLRETYKDFSSIKTPEEIFSDIFGIVSEALKEENTPRLKMTRF